MVMYDFQCHNCQKGYTVLLDPHNDDLSRQKCSECGSDMLRVFNVPAWRIDWVNPERGDGINLGLGKRFKSAREREDYAKANGFEKLES